MGNSSSTSRLGEEEGQEVYPIDNIIILHYSYHHPTSQISKHSSFGTSHLPITGPFVITTPNKSVFNSMNNQEIYDHYPKDFIKRQVEISTATKSTVGYYFFIPQRHTTPVMSHAMNIVPLLTGLDPDEEIKLDATADFVSIALPLTNDGSNFYRAIPRNHLWSGHLINPCQVSTQYQRDWLSSINVQPKYHAQTVGHDLSQIEQLNLFKQMFPFSNLPKKPSSKPSLTGLVNVKRCTIGALSQDSVKKIHHRALPPFQVACIMFDLLDTGTAGDVFSASARNTTSPIQPILDFTRDLSDAIRGGQLLNWHLLPVHIFIQAGSRIHLDSETLTADSITKPFEKIGYPLSKINIHYLEPDGPTQEESWKDVASQRTHSYEYAASPSIEQVNKIIWPEILSAFLQIQSNKAAYQSLCTMVSGVKIKPWIPYNLWTPANHIEQLRRSLLTDATRGNSALLNNEDFWYNPSTVARALASMNIPRSNDHVSNAIKKRFDHVIQLNRKGLDHLHKHYPPNPNRNDTNDDLLSDDHLVNQLPTNEYPFIVNNEYQEFQFTQDHAPALFNNAAPKRMPLLPPDGLRNSSGMGQPRGKLFLNELEFNAFPPLPKIPISAQPRNVVDDNVGSSVVNNGSHSSSSSSSLAKNGNHAAENDNDAETGGEDGEEDNEEDSEETDENNSDSSPRADLSTINPDLNSSSETQFVFNAFISNRYLLNLEEQTAEMHSIDSHPDLSRNYRITMHRSLTNDTLVNPLSYFEPVQELPRLNIVGRNVDWKVNQHFTTEVHSIFPNINTNLSPINYAATLTQLSGLEQNQMHIELYSCNRHVEGSETGAKFMATTADGDGDDDDDDDDDDDGTKDGENRNRNIILSEDTMNPNNIGPMSKFYTPEQLSLISQRKITPTRSTINYMYRNDNSLYLPFSVRQWSSQFLVGWSPSSRRVLECNGLNEPSLFLRPLQYLYGVHLFQYNLNFVQPQVSPSSSSFRQQQSRLWSDHTATNSETTLPPSFQPFAGQFRIPSLSTFFPLDVTETTTNDNAGNSVSHLNIPPEWREYQQKKQNPPFEPYQLTSVIHDLDESHCNGHLFCPMHVIFILSTPKYQQSQANKTYCRVLNEQLAKSGKIPLQSTELQNNDCRELYNALLTTTAPTPATPESIAIEQFRNELNTKCRKQLQESVFLDKLVPPQRIDALWHFHIIPHEHLESLLVQIQANAVMKRLQLYAGGVLDRQNRGGRD